MSGKIRRAQTVTTFGVGAVVDVNGEGFVIADTSRWNSTHRKTIGLPRLSRAMGNKRLLGFGNDESNQFVPVARFPSWYFCPRNNCRRLREVTPEEDSRAMQAAGDDVDMPPTPKCMSCGAKMSPMRWVAYCDSGHLSDIDWHRWCHYPENPAEWGQCGGQVAQLKFVITGRSGGDFDQMHIKCCNCDKKRDLSDVQRKYVMPSFVYARKGMNCSGRQPWRRGESAGDCDERMRIEPRGSSSMYRARTLSALDLRGTETDFESTIDPSKLDELHKMRGNFVDEMRGLGQAYEVELKDSSSKIRTHITMLCQISHQLEEEKVINWFRDKFAEGELEAPEVEDIEQLDLLLEEYAVFKEHEDLSSRYLCVDFRELTRSDGDLASGVFSHIGAVRKLREVRVFTGFCRGKGESVVPPDINGDKDWLPAVEAWGEGIYFELNSKKVSEWLQSNGETIENCLRGQYQAFERYQANSALQVQPTPIFFLTHTLAHLLIRELTFRSGYSSSALRERVYVDSMKNNAAILIYTTDSDSEGTLGGLVEQARVENLPALVEKVSNSARWCSADPVCRETESQGLSGLNASACHCCSLISETSCAYQNIGLNRIMLGGLGPTQGEPFGFFEHILRSLY